MGFASPRHNFRRSEGGLSLAITFTNRQGKDDRHNSKNRTNKQPLQTKNYDKNYFAVILTTFLPSNKFFCKSFDKDKRVIFRF